MGVFEFEVRGIKGRINVTALVEHVNVLRGYRASLEERFRREHFDPSPEAHAVAGRRSQFEVEELTTGFLRDLSGEFLLRKMHAIERMTEIEVELRELAIKTGETMTVEALDVLETRSRDLIRERDTHIDELRRTAPEHAGPNTMEAARQHAVRLRQWADSVAAERRLLKDIEALRTATGEVDPAARARLLEQIPEMPAGTDAEVLATAARVLGFRPDAIRIKLVGTDPGQVGQVGVSGAKVYLVRAVDGDVTVAAVKVFPKSPTSDAQIEEFARELSALNRLGREDLPNQGVVRRLGAGRTADGSGVLIMSGAAGRSIDSMLVALSKREISLEEVRVAVERNGEALGRLHSATANATPASPVVTEGFVKDFNESLQQLEALSKTDLTPPALRFRRHEPAGDRTHRGSEEPRPRRRGTETIIPATCSTTPRKDASRRSTSLVPINRSTRLAPASPRRRATPPRSYRR